MKEPYICIILKVVPLTDPTIKHKFLSFVKDWGIENWDLDKDERIFTVFEPIHDIKKKISPEKVVTWADFGIINVPIPGKPWWTGKRYTFETLTSFEDALRSAQRDIDNFSEKIDNLPGKYIYYYNCSENIEELVEKLLQKIDNSPNNVSIHMFSETDYTIRFEYLQNNVSCVFDVKNDTPEIVIWSAESKLGSNYIEWSKTSIDLKEDIDDVVTQIRETLLKFINSYGSHVLEM